MRSKSPESSTPSRPRGAFGPKSPSSSSASRPLRAMNSPKRDWPRSRFCPMTISVQYPPRRSAAGRHRKSLPVCVRMAAKPMRGSSEQNEAKSPWNVEPPLAKKCSKYTLSPRRRSRNGVTRTPRTVWSRNRRSNPSTKIISTLGRRPSGRSSRTPGGPVVEWTSGYRDDGNSAPGAMISRACCTAVCSGISLSSSRSVPATRVSTARSTLAAMYQKGFWASV